MRILENPWRQSGFRDVLPPETPFPSVDTEGCARLLRLCPAHAETPLVDAAALARRSGVARVWVKDERARMRLGSFKALGAAYVIACRAAQGGNPGPASLAGETFVTASAGNHGLSVAAGARLFGANAKVFIAETVPDVFARRLADKGADVLRAGADYQASMRAAQAAAQANGWQLLSDSSWPGYFEHPWRLMEGYLQLAVEAVEQLPSPPTHVFLQAGVGGLAGAVAAYARHVWGDKPRIAVVEPEFAPALFESIAKGRPVVTRGPASAMGRLDCKEPSLIPLKGLARDADCFVTVTETEALDAMPVLAASHLATTPSGGAGVAGLLALAAKGGQIGLDKDARVLAIVSEEPQA